MTQDVQHLLQTLDVETKEGADMAVEDIRAGIATAREKCNTSLAALQQAQQAIEEAQQILGQVTAGSGQAEVTQAHGMLQEVAQGVSGQQNTIQGAISAAESYAQRL